MSTTASTLGISLRRSIGAAGIAVPCAGIATAAADTLLDPPVFASQNGVLDIMMVAMPQPISTIAFKPPMSSTVIEGNE